MAPLMDRSEIEGLGFQCIDGCAYCCLCPPELSGRDREHFRRAHPSAVEEADGSAQLALQGGAGGCSLLKDRRCTDYGNRPFHCRAFPLRVHFLDRVQCCGNFSCRGIDRGRGAPLGELLDSVLRMEAAAGWENEAAAARREWGNFVGKALRTGVPVELQGTRLLVSDMISRWPEGLEAGHEEVVELVSETFGISEAAQLPVYVTPSLEWQVFQVRQGAVRRSVLAEAGGLSPSGEWPLQAVPMLEMTSEARSEFCGYLQLLNRRDPMAGSAALVVRATDFEEEFEEAYLEILRDCALDLWWRSSLLAVLKGASVLGAPEIREGIVFCDADFLDMAGIGGML